MSMSVIVTGAAGFIGSHLTRALLNRGDRVLGIDNFDGFYDRAIKDANVAANEHANFELVEADIADASAMTGLIAQRRPDVIFHIAALAGVRPSILEPARYMRMNLEGLTNILEAARAADCSDIVFASSSSVYGNNKTVPFAETDFVGEPISPYAASKRAGELICHAAAHLHGLRIASLRFFTVFGPAQRPDLAINKFMRLIAADDDIPMFGDGTTSRDYTFIDDIIQGVLAAQAKVMTADPGFHRIYNLGGSEPVMLSDMIDQIGRVIGRTPRIKTLPMQPGDVDRTFADLTRSRDELGFQPSTPFAEGLARQWEWMREQS